MNKKTFVIITLLALAFFCPLPKNITAAKSLETPAPYSVGQWLPSDQLFLDQWMAKLTEGAESANEPLQPVIQEFKNIIQTSLWAYAAPCRECPIVSGLGHFYQKLDKYKFICLN